jgi:hypothetical protein
MCVLQLSHIMGHVAIVSSRGNLDTSLLRMLLEHPESQLSQK